MEAALRTCCKGVKIGKILVVGGAFMGVDGNLEPFRRQALRGRGGCLRLRRGGHGAEQPRRGWEARGPKSPGRRAPRNRAQQADRSGPTAVPTTDPPLPLPLRPP